MVHERSKVLALYRDGQSVSELKEGDSGVVVIDNTPFYAEGGGQVGDQGVLVGPEGRVEIKETTRPVPALILHKGVVTKGRIREGEQLRLTVNRATRQDAARNHTATHLVHAALRDMLGPHDRRHPPARCSAGHAA